MSLKPMIAGFRHFGIYFAKKEVKMAKPGEKCLNFSIPRRIV